MGSPFVPLSEAPSLDANQTRAQGEASSQHSALRDPSGMIFAVHKGAESQILRQATWSLAATLQNDLGREWRHRLPLIASHPASGERASPTSG